MKKILGFVFVLIMVLMYESNASIYASDAQIYEILPGESQEIRLSLRDVYRIKQGYNITDIEDEASIVWKGRYTFVDQEDENPINLDLLIQKKVNGGEWETIHTSKLTRFKSIRQKQVKIHRDRREATEEENNVTYYACWAHSPGIMICDSCKKIKPLIFCYKDQYRALLVNHNKNAVDVSITIFCNHAYPVARALVHGLNLQTLA